MAITIIVEPHGLAGERQVVFGDDDTDFNSERLVIHPWVRDHSAIGHGVQRQVYLALGKLSEEGYGIADENGDDSDGYYNLILNREDFIEGILAVFPELKRA